jgi:hypothetical protein
MRTEHLKRYYVCVCVLQACLCTYMTSWLEIMIRDMNQLNGLLLGIFLHLYSKPL